MKEKPITLADLEAAYIEFARGEVFTWYGR